jgi:hypothetical protein
LCCSKLFLNNFRKPFAQDMVQGGSSEISEGTKYKGI